MDLMIDLNNLIYKDDGDGKVDATTDRVGVLAYSKNMQYPLDNMTVEFFSYGAHVQYTELDDTGKPIATFNSENNMKFFDKLYTLYCDSNIGYLYSEDPQIMEVFAMGNALLTLNVIRDAESYLTEMEDDYLVLPLPMLDRDQFKPDTPSKGYTTGLGDSLSHFAICAYAGIEKIPAITATMELMGYYSKLWVTPAFYDVNLKGRFARDPRTAAMVDMIHEGIYSCFGLLWSSKLDNITWKIRTNYDDTNRQRTYTKANKTLTNNLNKLLTEIEEAWFINKAT